MEIKPNIIVLLLFLTFIYPLYSAPYLNFTSLTPSNNSNVSINYFELNVSIIEQNLDSVTHNFNGTNYTLYNDSLVAMYNFNNVSALGENRTRIVDMWGTNNGTTGDVLNWTSDGKYGGAYNFNGSGSIGVSGLTSYHPPIRASFWINPHSLGSGWFWVFLKYAGPPSWDGAGVILDSSNRVGIWLNGGSADVYAYSTETVPVDEWSHIYVEIINGDYNSIYLNGERVLYQSISVGSYVESTSLTISSGFNGTIDEMKFFSRSLSEQEIQMDYMSNLEKYNTTQWYFYVNQTKNATTCLDQGIYTYQVFAQDSDSNSNNTEIRTINVDLAPTTTLIIPSQGAFNDSSSPVEILFNCSATDAIGLKNLSLYITNSSNQSLTFNQTINISGTSGFLNTTLNLTNGNYTWNCIAYDLAGNSDWSTNRSLIINYSPSITVDYPTEGLNLTNGTSINLSFTVLSSNLNTSTCLYYLDGNSTGISIPDCLNTTFNITSNIYGSHILFVSANDTFGNFLNSSTVNFTISNVYGNNTAMNSSGYSNLSANIDGNNNTDHRGLSGVHAVNFTDLQNNVLTFNYNFTLGTLNLSAVTIATGNSSGKFYSYVYGINSSNIINGKTLHIYNASTNYSKVCVKDQEGISYLNISSTCTGSNEYQITCDGTSQYGFNCTMDGANITISGLNNSVVIQFESSTPTPSTSPSSSSTSKSSVSISTSQECENEEEVLIVEVSSGSNPVDGIEVILFATDIYYNENQYTDENGKAEFTITQVGTYKIKTEGTSEYISSTKTKKINSLDCAPIEEEPECISNIDCSDDEICSNEECIKLEEPECGYISDHEIMNYGCCEDSQCSENYYCASNVCVEKVLPKENATNEQAEVAIEEAQKAIEEAHTTITLMETELAIKEAEDITLNAKNAKELLQDSKDLLIQAQEALENEDYVLAQQLAEQSKLLAQKSKELKEMEQPEEKEEFDLNYLYFGIVLLILVIIFVVILKWKNKSYK